MLESEPGTTVTRNVGWLLLGNTVGKMAFLAAGVLAARHLGTKEYGVYSFATFFSFIFATLADGGLQTILIRETARDKGKASQYLGTVLLLKCAMTLLALLLLSGAVLLMGLAPIQVQAVYLSMAAFLALSYTNTAVAIFRAFERMVFDGVVTALQGLLFLLLVLTGILMRADILPFVAALLVSYLISLLLAFYLVVTRFARPRFLLDAELARFLVREALPVGASLFLFIFYGRIGAVAIEVMRDSAEVGTFSAAFNLVRNLNFVPIAFAAAVLPTLSKSAVSNPGRFSRLYTTSLKAMLLLGLPLAMGGMILAEPVVLLVYGPAFAEAGASFRIIAWSVPFSFLSLLSSATLESINRQVQWTYTLAVGVGANLLLNAVLIPQSGIVGASWALLVTDILIFLVALYFVLRRIPGLTRDLLKLGLSALGGAIVLGLTLLLLSGQHLVLATSIAGLTYLSSLLLFKVIGREDLSLLKRALMSDQEKSVHLGRADS